MKTFRRALVAALIGLGTLGTAHAAKITIKDGSVLIGDVQQPIDGFYTVQTSYGTIKIPVASVIRIDPPDASGSKKDDAPTESGPTLRLAGSTTIGDELMPALVERYAGSLSLNQMHWTIEGDASEQAFKATGSGEPFLAHLSRHGSATAFTALAAGKADIGMASRQVKPDEIQTLQAAGFGVADAPGQEHVLALDGLVVLVNRENPLATLSLTQLASIFSGETTDWKDVGGSPGPIHVFGRDKKSGTADTFNGIVMKDKKLAPTATLMDSSDGLSDKVASDPAAIGFAGFAYVRLAKALRVLTDCGLEIPPSDFFVRTEEYPLSRRLFLYTSAHADDRTNQFTAFVLSEHGQDEVARKGFVDLAPRLSAPDYSANRIATALAQVARTEGDTSGDLRALQTFNRIAAAGRRVSITFRFRSSSFDLDTRAVRDIDRLAAAVRNPEMAHRKMIIIGFSDAAGSPTKNMRLALSRADRIARLLRSKGVVPQGVIGLGRAAPVACNTSPQGMEKNRRVEVWLTEPRP